MVEFTFDADIDLDVFQDEDWKESLALSDAEAAKEPIEHKSPPKGYPKEKSKYADPKRFKYPIDTEKHVRAALSYFSKPHNRAGYSAEEQKSIWARIVRAAKKLGIKVHDKTKSDMEVNQDMSGEKNLETVIAELQKIGKTLVDFKAKGAGDDPLAEEFAELEKLGVSKYFSKSIMEAVETMQEVSETMQDEQKEKTAELETAKSEIASLKLKVEAGEKAVQELAEIKAQATLASRLKELVEAGVRIDGDSGKIQEERIKAMSDEQFVSYKTEMTSLKASFEAERKKVEDEAKAKAEVEEKAKAEAAEKAKAEAEKIPAKADLSAVKTDKTVATLNKEVKISTDLISQYSKI